MKSGNNRTTVGRVRDQLVRYHQLILPESKPKQNDPPKKRELQKMSDKLERLIEQGNNYEEQVKYMREIRVSLKFKI